MYLGMMGIGKDMNTENIVDWYRTYCKIECMPIPYKFMTDEEKHMHDEAMAELGARNDSEE
ncbi:putative replication origin binding protein [Escherichia phage SUT_E420]|nr:putative replication origin binding protein [Escherichia phage SUT_E420]